MNIADALYSKTFEDGSVIIKQVRYLNWYRRLTAVVVLQELMHMNVLTTSCPNSV